MNALAPTVRALIRRAALGIAESFIDPRDQVLEIARVIYQDNFGSSSILKGADRDLSAGISVRQDRCQPADRRRKSVRAAPQRTLPLKGRSKSSSATRILMSGL
jgi:hypothetical protein